MEKIAEAYTRISAAVTDDEPVTMSGVFGGAQLFSGSFEFQPDGGDLIRGNLDPELSEEAATAMNTHFTKQRATAKMKMTTVSTRAGKKKPTYELTALLPIEEPPRRAAQPPPPENNPPAESGAPGEQMPPDEGTRTNKAEPPANTK